MHALAVGLWPRRPSPGSRVSHLGRVRTPFVRVVRARKSFPIRWFGAILDFLLVVATLRRDRKLAGDNAQRYKQHPIRFI